MLSRYQISELSSSASSFKQEDHNGVAAFVFCRKHKICRKRSPLQNMVVATHRKQQQALDLLVGEINHKKSCSKRCKTKAANIGKELATLIPNVGDDRHLKLTRNE